MRFSVPTAGLDSLAGGMRGWPRMLGLSRQSECWPSPGSCKSPSRPPRSQAGRGGLVRTQL